MTSYYNEYDPFAAQWLRNLIKAGLIAPGDVDERSIEDVKPSDLSGYRQCHFFAGIGVWSWALRRAGWEDSRPVWTGSCPCQPFSSAGSGEGFADERHLWPAFFHLIQQRRPPAIFGEQVASPDGLAWFDLVQTDLEAEGYATGCADLCAAGVGAPHLRQRLYWLAYSQRSGSQGLRAERELGKSGSAIQTGGNCNTGEWANSQGFGRGQERQDVGGFFAGNSPQGESSRFESSGGALLTLPPDSFWGGADWLQCRDGRWRPVEPGTFPLVDGASSRVGRLRGYGNAIVGPVAEIFIKAAMEFAP